MIKHIGNITGEMLIFGGVYSNYQALKALMALAVEKNIPKENIICTGDIAGYCAEPELSIQSVKTWGIHCIAGNVEKQLRADEEDCGCSFIPGSRCDSFSKEWYPYALENISKGSKEWMATLPDNLSFKYGKKSVLVVHGSFHETSEFIFKSTPWSIKQRNFDHSDSDVILAGHCGLPFADAQNDKLWLNAGVIGMPANDATPNVWCMLLNTTDKGEVIYQHLSFSYNHLETHRLMEEKDLPEAYRKTILSGIWDNCEILPPDETSKQGLSIKF